MLKVNTLTYICIRRLFYNEIIQEHRNRFYVTRERCFFFSCCIYLNIIIDLDKYNNKEEKQSLSKNKFIDDARVTDHNVPFNFYFK